VRLDRGENTGRNSLVKLAMRIFAIVANSAGCERVFSEFGITHTKRRNKLNPKKVHQMAIVGMQTKREDRELGLDRKRTKCKFAEVDDSTQSQTDTPPSASAIDSSDDEDPTDFQQYVEGLLNQVQQSNEEEQILPPTVSVLQPGPPITSMTHSQYNPSTTSSRQSPTQIPLIDLFNYTMPPENGLEFYWPGCKKNLEDLLAVHENLSD